MENRKIIKFGNSSYVLTIPQDWIKKHNLGKGNEVNITQNDNSLIISLEKEKEERIAQINLDNKPLKLFNRELISYYLKNYKTIKINGKDVIERLEEIKILKEKLSSVEIVEISKDHITLKDLTNTSELDLCKLIREIIEMEKMLLKELIEFDKKSNNQFFISSLDSNINKLTFLAQKAINYNMDSLNDTQQIKDSIHYHRIVSSLETIGDIAKRVARYLKDIKKEHMHHIGTTLKNMENYFTFITNLLEKNINIQNNLKLHLDKKQSLLRDFETLREDLKDNVNLYLVITQLFKDILGQLDTITLSIIDLNTK